MIKMDQIYHLKVIVGFKYICIKNFSFTTSANYPANFLKLYPPISNTHQSVEPQCS